MKDKIKKNKRTILVINVILAVYIFTLSIGYAIFGETLKISGTAGTDNPDLKVCPFEMQELTTLKNSTPTTDIKRYFAEFYDLENFNKPNLGQIVVFDSYDKRNNTYNFFTQNVFLFPHDPDNPKGEQYKTIARPMYIALKNTTAYSFDSFNIVMDVDNAAPFGPPIEGIDIRTTVISDLGQMVEIIDRDEQNDEYWVNETISVFEPAGVMAVGTDEYNGLEYYHYESLTDVLEFPTSSPVWTDDYLIIGIKFPEVINAVCNDCVNGSFKDFAPIGISFKIWPTDFDEESAFRVRMAFVDESTHLDFVGNVQKFNEFYDDPTSNPYPVDWWMQ